VAHPAARPAQTLPACPQLRIPALQLQAPHRACASAAQVRSRSAYSIDHQAARAHPLRVLWRRHGDRANEDSILDIDELHRSNTCRGELLIV